MTIYISEEDTKLFQNNGFSYDDVSNTVNHYREIGLSDEEIQNKINTRISEFKLPIKLVDISLDYCKKVTNQRVNNIFQI